MTTLGRRVEISELLKLYGRLLTDKQRQALSLHYDEDFSLGEIAEQFSVSRQNVYELMTRGEKLLRHYEDALQVAHRINSALKNLSAAKALLAGGSGAAQAIALIEQSEAVLEGEENGV